jgi:hypothetical protein
MHGLRVGRNNLVDSVRVNCFALQEIVNLVVAHAKWARSPKYATARAALQFPQKAVLIRGTTRKRPKKNRATVAETGTRQY